MAYGISTKPAKGAGDYAGNAVLIIVGIAAVLMAVFGTYVFLQNI